MKGIYIYISYLLIYQMKDDSFLPPGCCYTGCYFYINSTKFSRLRMRLPGMC